MGKRLEVQLQKIDPRLRMIANGDEVVNTHRAEQAPDMIVTDSKLAAKPTLRDQPDKVITKQEIPEYKREKLEETTDNININVFVQLKEDYEGLPSTLEGPVPTTLIDRILSKFRSKTSDREVFRRDNLLVVDIPLGRLQELLDDPGVVSVERAEHIRFSPPIQGRGVSSISEHTRCVPNAPEHDKKVLIGIIDVGGFDFTHPDFRINDNSPDTRFVKIWDQGGSSRPAPLPYGYGSEITKEMMDAALQAENNSNYGMPAYELEPQSQMVVGSHATHVASIAGGNNGVCPEAFLAGVLIHLPKEDLERRKSFYDSTRIVHGVEYLLRLGEELSEKHGMDIPVSVNISLGTNGHSHDGSSPTSRWIDSALSTAGRALCVAAGNAGQEAASHPTDWGFVMGRIHTSGKFKRPGDSVELEWIVFGDSIIDLSENELEIWYSPRDRIGIEIKPPNEDWISMVAPGKFFQNFALDNGTFLSIYNELYKPSNGLNHIGCYLSPMYGDDYMVGIQAGTWKVRLTGLDVRDGEFHAWIERDDPRPIGGGEGQGAWFFPSFFSKDTNVDNTSVSSLACGINIISVANLDVQNNKAHISSSQGPTRDGRPKPEIIAPGTDIVAAKGFDPNEKWISMTGTSMASPYVTGVAGLMLTISPELTASQIQAIMHRTANPVFGNFTWRNDTGYGRINPEACLIEVEKIALEEVRP